MRKSLLSAAVLAVGALALYGCSPPSRIDKHLTCEGQYYQLGVGEGGEPYIVIDNTLVSCAKYVNESSIIRDHMNCCATIPLYRADMAAKERLQQLTAGTSKSSGGHHGP